MQVFRLIESCKIVQFADAKEIAHTPDGHPSRSNMFCFNYLIIVISKHQLSHHFPPQLGLVGCVRDLVVEGSSVALAEVSNSS